ncbi:hypothetical protein SEA_PIPERIS_24 [Microbacterium phage Piperis]|uniref:Uncharacterized protein n=3 Tax=Quhwahvirus TaxID=2733202 RepID=A0A2U8UQ02_9CAUD|nr:hypothetical protein HOT30_gp23 [Microbacterium phage Paschalis]QCW22582.1 hypothetical protein SEA_PIPERIS_24 [Microbacterium phage Piperis]QGH76562.1 hypothetical protein SEA_ANTARES_24 [Microbacterium phage Antares]QXN74816.1 hypothetical protein SEA_PHRANCESCO_24 [Microbacterium phage Phrancesco]UVK63204.1 hypothetical protein SEA_PHORGEOUS_23 [Microbacterium phage Phorgeous]AWN05516.1 hypothetical protein SEA_PASCHALIS_23 [Microbacterium phage Paschalis]
MRDAFVNEHQDNYFDAEEAGVAAHTAQSKLLNADAAQYLDREHTRFPDTAFPFSGDHLGTFSHRETTPQGDPGDEVRRERIRNSDIDLWAMVAA